MAKQMIVKPYGWACKLSECPPGHFVFDGSLCFKTEYGDLEVFNNGGEAFWGGVKTKEEVADLMVQPVDTEWTDVDW